MLPEGTVRIRRLKLLDRGDGRRAVVHSLTAAPWPETASGEYLILRRLSVQGSAAEIIVMDSNQKILTGFSWRKGNVFRLFLAEGNVFRLFLAEGNARQTFPLPDK